MKKIAVLLFLFIIILNIYSSKKEIYLLKYTNGQILNYGYYKTINITNYENSSVQADVQIIINDLNNDVINY